MAICGCGSATTQAEKQARIKAALARLEGTFEREKAALRARVLSELTQRARVLSELKTRPVKGLGVVREALKDEQEEARKRADILVRTPAPKGVASAEWGAAIDHDVRLHRLVLGAGAHGSPTGIEVATPAAVTRAGGRTLAEYEAGKLAVAQSGCLACHKIGENGNAGPGPDLSEVADRLPKQAIARTLAAPTAPMPSFKSLPPAKFHAMVAFLADLK